jgi:predicted alpha/beta superfamily hydrolase
MKALMSLCIIWILANPFVSGQVATIDQIKTEPIIVNTGISFKLHSKVLNEDRTVMIALPEGYDNNTRKYPVFYLLDGQWGFNFKAQTIDWLSNPQYGMIPQMIVVSLHTGENRTRDLTPTQNKESKSGGGADKFYKFIKEELIPFIDKNYRTYNYRILSGESLSALFVMYAFICDPMVFNGYHSLSPSMWWDNQIMLDRTNDFLSKNPILHNRLYLSLTNEGTQMGVDSLAAILEKYSPKGLIWKYDKHPEEVHETVGFKGTWDGMKFLLADWYYPLVDFGTKEHLFSSQDSATLGAVTHKIRNQSDKILDSHSGLYLDSYHRILTIIKADKTLQFSGYRLPTVTLYSETENKFFVKDINVQNELFLKGINVQFEFVKDDSLVVTANGKIDCSAKKIKCPPLVKLSDDILNQYVGTYLPLKQSNNLHITKEGNSLKLSEETSLTYLYPVAENRFFVFIQGSGYDLEFIKDGSNNILKMNVSKDGNAVFEATKIN